MSNKRIYFALLALVIILGAAGVGAAVYGNIALSKKNERLVALKAENIALDEQQRSLNQAKKDVQTYEELEKIVKSIVPQEKDQARTVREIVKLAEESGIRLGTISFPVSNLGQVTPKSSTGTTGTTTPATGSTTSSAPTQVKPVEGIAGLYQMDISIQSGGNVPYSGFLRFLQKLEQNRRTSQLSNVTVQPIANSNNVTFNLTINVFIKP